MDAATQEFIAIALVLVVVGAAVLRRLTKPKSDGCNSCKSNPNGQDKTGGPESESIIQFVQKPGKPK